MKIIALFLILILIIISLIHFYWAVGGKVSIDKVIPIKDGKPMFKPSGFMTFLIGIIFIGFAFVAYMLAFSEKDFSYAGYGSSLLFFLRAIGDFNVVGFFKKIRSSQFAVYDIKIYSPFSFFIGTLFLLLVCKV